MSEVRTIVVNRSAYADNDAEASLLREELKQKGVYLINVMSSPGAGKTTTLIKLINELKDTFKVGVMEADIDSDVDAVNVAKETKVKSIQLQTSGMCHLDVGMTRRGLEEIGYEDLDLIFLENVGNLVCPAEFDTGACLDVMILSIPEGDDKPLKYPLIFEKCDLVMINKIDTIEYFNFDFDKCKEVILFRNPNAKVIPISALTGEGIEKVKEYVVDKVNKWRERKHA